MRRASAMTSPDPVLAAGPRPHGPVRPTGAAAVLALQRTAGNAAVATLVRHVDARHGQVHVQRCGPVPCDCSDDERAAKQTTGSLDTRVQRLAPDTTAAPTVQRAVACPVGVDPAEGTGCYEVPDAAAANDNAVGPANDNAAPAEAAESAQAAEATQASGTVTVAGEAGEATAAAGEAAEAGTVAAEAAEGAVLAEEAVAAGAALEAVPGIGTIAGTALILGAGGYLAYRYLTRDNDGAAEASSRRSPRGRREPQPGPEPHIDPQTGEEVQPQDSCDFSQFKDCQGEPRSRSDALAELRQREGGATAVPSGGVQGTGLCFKDGQPRNVSGATHETFRVPGTTGPDGIVGSIVCCNCCVRGTNGQHALRCTVK